MRKFLIIPMVSTLLISLELIARNAGVSDRGDHDSTSARKHKMNFFIISKPKKPDPGMYFQIVRTQIRNLTKKKKFSAIVVGSSSEMSEKVIRRIKKHNAVISNLWFDSHGYYAKG